jgi:hypothetical protein
VKIPWTMVADYNELDTAYPPTGTVLKIPSLT